MVYKLVAGNFSYEIRLLPFFPKLRGESENKNDPGWGQRGMQIVPLNLYKCASLRAFLASVRVERMRWAAFWRVVCSI
jgi:hypothetical protein